MERFHWKTKTDFQEISGRTGGMEVSEIRAPERTKQMKKQGPLTSCDTCGNYVYDDDYGYYLCEADLDEDEMAAFLGNQRFVCPYYQTDDEYKIVRKQM